ncbi:hypothetical protein SPRG_22242 [Saprolegnia parasitica CBS 223.65]|uniref:PDZ domain-containing protein n=1 Tax=Saprolegnia parasitica (strain CBS 223.65) TaxID=695850 RepID=A0A067C3A4_SAPPC|nr:hypothetical protein SPRG_22242 [Saprolegnia parasitica CBS 223.65]KDO25229.1 hypothetical protein SPRG_22242 [Saprolegnia parasitica CBS 223.65]|eukprot:XP_012204128.1 hypothetical protein SPRG_22242 [Saprolegnia parasitica CBS 223.65]
MTPQALPSPVMSPQALPSPIMSPAPVFTPMQSPEVMTPLQSPLSSVHSPMHSTVLTPTATTDEVPAVVCLADDLDDTTREMAPSFTDRASDVSAMTDRASDANPMILANQDDAMSTLYSIIWTGGPLGIAIKLNRHDEVCVMALTGGGLAGESDIINVGDVLVAVGNVTVRQATLEETSRVLKETPTPVSLVSMDMVPTSARGISTSVDDAHSSPSSSESKAGAIFSVVWEGGPLGIVVRKNAQDENFVKDFTGDGLSAQSDLIRRGDVLISVADVRVRNLSLAAASQVMQSVRKPTFLVFRRQALADANAAA